MIIPPAARTESVKEYYFSVKNKELARLGAERAARGEPPIINLGIGSPDGMPPEPALDVLCRECRKEGSSRYQSYTGLPELRKAFADWYLRYYGVTLDPASEIQPLMGSKEGILILSLSFLNPGDKVLVPDPGYPTYSSATALSGAVMVPYTLKKENGWQPDFDAIEKDLPEGVKMMWMNYPNMPTGAPASVQTYRRAVEFGMKHKILIVNDNPYSFILNDKPLSIFGAPGAFECCLELNSLSKAHNMAGWRVGMVAGQADMITQILKVKSQQDSGMYKPLQLAAAEALRSGPEWYKALNAKYSERRVLIRKIFDRIGAGWEEDSAGLFVWGHVRDDSPALRLRPAQEGRTRGEAVSDAILYGCGVFITPGFVFGRSGDDYIRSSLCASKETLDEAYARIDAMLSGK